MGARNMKARASDALDSAKGRINEYRTGKNLEVAAEKKSSGPGDFDTTMPFESVFPKASRGQRAKMSFDMAKGEREIWHQVSRPNTTSINNARAQRLEWLATVTPAMTLSRIVCDSVEKLMSKTNSLFHRARQERKTNWWRRRWRRRRQRWRYRSHDDAHVGSVCGAGYSEWNPERRRIEQQRQS